MNGILTAVAAILIFAILIFVHELGHFIAAKASGVKVNEFALGMGPKIFKKQKGETLYSVRLFPIGGSRDHQPTNGRQAHLPRHHCDHRRAPYLQRNT